MDHSVLIDYGHHMQHHHHAQQAGMGRLGSGDFPADGEMGLAMLGGGTSVDGEPTPQQLHMQAVRAKQKVGYD